MRAVDGITQYLSDHLGNVSRLAARHASKLNLHRAGEVIGLLHDLGKYSSAFQAYIRSATGLLDQDADSYVDPDSQRGRIDHSSAGAQFIWQRTEHVGGLGPFVGQILALCIASHHSGLIDCLSPNSSDFGADVFVRRMKKASENTHIDEVLRSADSHVLSRATALVGSPDLISEIKSAAGRVAAMNAQAAPPLHQQLGLIVRFLFSCLLDADRTDTAGFESEAAALSRQNNTYRSWPELCNRIEAHLGSLPAQSRVNQIRRGIAAECLEAAGRPQGIFTLTVPTGGGKTLASLRFALHHALKRNLDRIFYVIPYTSIIDQNADVARGVLEVEAWERGRIVLEHHSNLAPERQSWRVKMLSENWDAPVVFTTMVQFLEALFGGGTRGARRMHQLANSVLVFDEVQTLPVRCVHLFNNAVNFLSEQCNSTVLLCTATQPLLSTVEPKKGAIRLSASPELVSDPKALFRDLQRVEVQDARRPGGWMYTSVAELALQCVEAHTSCLVVVNTKEAARSIYRNCCELDEERRFHLSTHMCPAHRRQILAKVKTRLDQGLPVLCVSTQLIEAGVDVDFASVIRSLAGLDSLAQASGRCNRNGTRTKGIVHIVNVEEEKLTGLVDIAIGREKAERVLNDFRDCPERFGTDLFGPQALEDYYHYYFYERARDMTYPVQASASGLAQGDTLLNLLSGNEGARNEKARKEVKRSDAPFAQSFQTAARLFEAIDGPTQGVIVPFGSGKELIGSLAAAYAVEAQYALLRQAQQFTVAVFPQVFSQLRKASAIFPVQEGLDIFCLDERYYNAEYGLTTEPSSEMTTLYV